MRMHWRDRLADLLVAIPWKKAMLGVLALVAVLPLALFAYLWYVSVWPDVPPHRAIEQVVYLDEQAGACKDFPVDAAIRSTMPDGAFDAGTRNPDSSYQGWCEPYRQAYYRLPQGTTFFGLRYDWIAHLERPVGRTRLATRDYMESIGFIYDGANKPNRNNPADLPIGLTWHRDAAGNKLLDISCAACHSSQLTYRGKALQIDGGSGGHALTSSSPSQFIGMTVAALFTTYLNPFKFDRLADKVLGDVREEQRTAARSELRSAMWQTLKEAAVYGWYNNGSLYPTAEGYGRTDGLARIVNTVFGDNLDRSNYRLGNAPVNYPHLWDIWGFDWVQWMGSVKQAMARNLNESLGVRARLELKDDAHRFTSSAMLPEMHCIETVLQHLKAPRWPTALFGPVDEKLAASGQVLFDATCRKCHGPFRFDWEKADKLVDSGTPKAQIAPARPTQCSTCHGPWTGRPGQTNLASNAVQVAWSQPQGGEQHGDYRVRQGEYSEQTTRKEVWQVAHIHLDYVGTDPTSALNFIDNTYDLSALKDTAAGRAVTAPAGGKTVDRYIDDWKHVPGGVGLRFIGGEVRFGDYAQLGLWDPDARTPIKPEAVADLNGFGEEDHPMALHAYRPRPLEGVWATAPFLHNGSVPSIYQLLLPADERATVFWLGRKEYDPVNLGLRAQKFAGAFRYDTSVTGNSNRGHSFDDGLCGNGIIGYERADRPGFCRQFTEHERRALLEYLKVLSDEPRIDPGTLAHCEHVQWPGGAP